MEPTSFLINENIDTRGWLNYYRNCWIRNLTARKIDLNQDITKAEKEGYNMMVQQDDNGINFIPLAKRIELRKIAVLDAILLLESIEDLITDFDNNEGKKDAVYMDKTLLTPKEEETVPAAEAPAAPGEEVAAKTEASTETKPDAQPEAIPAQPEGEDKA